MLRATCYATCYTTCYATCYATCCATCYTTLRATLRATLRDGHMSNAQWAIGHITTAQVIRSGMLFSFLRNESSPERKPNKFYTNSPLNKMSCRHCSFGKTFVGKMSVGKMSVCGREQQWRHSTASRFVLFLYTLWRHLVSITVHTYGKNMNYLLRKTWKDHAIIRHCIQYHEQYGEFTLW